MDLYPNDLDPPGKMWQILIPGRDDWSFVFRECQPDIWLGSISIAPTRDCTHFLKIWFVVTGCGFYSYDIHQGNKLDNESKIVRKLWSFMHTKRFNTSFKYGCHSTSTIWLREYSFCIVHYIMSIILDYISVLFYYIRFFAAKINYTG